MNIELEGISKQFGTFRALDNINLTIQGSELLALLGPSGSGKSTLLRVVAGLELPDEGSVFFQGEDCTGRPARDRGVGFVFQHYALFRTMTVFENVAFGLRVRPRRSRPSKEEIRRRVMDLLAMVRLEELAPRYPHQLSGGQRQRVALARALAVEPGILLLDEPFGALDTRVRHDLRRRLRKLHDDLGVTSIFVTHDQEEALEVADRVVVMNKGRIEQVGTPEQVYDHPASRFVYNFFGHFNLFHSRSEPEDITHAPARIDAAMDGHVTNGHMGNFHPTIDPQVGYVRPHEIELEHFPEGDLSVGAVIRRIRPLGPIVRVELARLDNGALLEADLTRERFRDLELKRDELIYVKPQNLRYFTEDYSI